MKQILLGLFLFCCYGITVAAVTLRLEAPKAQLGQSFSLTLSLDGAQANSVPDLTPLQQDFIITGTESTVSYSIVNGQMNSVSEWNILLKAKRSGVLPIPALRIGKEKTAPTSIEITQKASTVNPSNTIQPNAAQPGATQQQQKSPPQQDVMLLTEVSVDKPYVNQQVIYTVRLYNSSRLLDANYQPPAVEDALLVPFGDGRRYQIMSNARLYEVEEQQFALFPQKSGDLKIKPPAFNALLYDMTIPRRVSVRAQPTVLKVKPIPPQFKDKDWLPAKQVTLKESYDKGTATLVEGSTLVRTVILQAVAVPAQLLPALNFGNSNEFSIYPEKPSETNTFKQPDLVGTSTIKITYLLNKTGKITIPALILPWFNTITKKEELSSLPETIINVTAAAGGVKPSKLTDSFSTSPSPQLITRPQAKETKRVVAAKSQTNFAWWLAGGFALAWLITLVAWRWQRPERHSSFQGKGQVLKQLREACLNNRPAQARDALLKWGRLQWPAANLLNLINLENLVDEPALKQQIKLLSEALYYDAKPHKLWQGGALWQCISAFKSSESVRKDKIDPLPPIHRL